MILKILSSLTLLGPSLLPAPGTQTPDHTALCLGHPRSLLLHLILGSPAKVKVEVSSLGLVWRVYRQGLSRWNPWPLAHPTQEGLRTFPRERRAGQCSAALSSPTPPFPDQETLALRNSSPTTLSGGFPFSGRAR